MFKTISLAFTIMGIAGAASGYTTHIENRTDKYIETGHVSLALCSGDDFTIKPNTSWSHGRGACLLTKITAKICGDSRSDPCVYATPYESSGTSYEKYIIQQDGKGGYVITRP